MRGVYNPIPGVSCPARFTRKTGKAGLYVSFWWTDNFDDILCPWKGYDLRPLYLNQKPELKCNSGTLDQQYGQSREWPTKLTAHCCEMAHINSIYSRSKAKCIYRYITHPWRRSCKFTPTGRCRYWRNWQDLRCNSMAGWLVGWLVHAAVHSPPLVTEIVPAHSRSHYKYNQHRPTSAWLWKQLNTFQEQLIHGMCFLLFMAGMYLRTVHVVYCMCIRLYGRVFAYSCTHRIVYMTWHLMFFASKQLYDTIETR